jgi:hypothetical protein
MPKLYCLLLLFVALVWSQRHGVRTMLPFADLPVIKVPNFFLLQNTRLNDSIVYYTTNRMVACNTTMIFFVSRSPPASNATIISMTEAGYTQTFSDFRMNTPSANELGSRWTPSTQTITLRESVQDLFQCPVTTTTTTGTVYLIVKSSISHQFVVALYTEYQLSSDKIDMAINTINLNTQ